jgi:hypothetical protein
MFQERQQHPKQVEVEVFELNYIHVAPAQMSFGSKRMSTYFVAEGIGGAGRPDCISTRHSHGRLI